MKKFILLLTIACCLAGILPAQTPQKNIDTYCSLAGKRGGNISVKEIVEAGKIVFEFPDTSWKVTHFSFSVVANKSYKEFQSDNEFLTAEMINWIQNVAGPRKLYVEYLRVGNGTGTRQLAPLSFVITE